MIILMARKMILIAMNMMLMIKMMLLLMMRLMTMTMMMPMNNDDPINLPELIVVREGRAASAQQQKRREKIKILHTTRSESGSSEGNSCNSARLGFPVGVVHRSWRNHVQ